MTTSVLTPAGDETPVAVPRFAREPVLAVAGLVAAAHLAVARIPGWWFDEALMLAIGRDHLDWGSADQPPLAPLLAAVMDTLAPGSLLALRVPAILATAAAVVVAALVAREVGGDTRAQTLTAIAQGTGIVPALGGHWLTPYMLEPVQWLLMEWLLVRWGRTRDDRLLLALGVVVGVAAQTKFQVLLLCAVLLAAVLVLGPRALLRRPKLWAGAVLAGLFAAPTLVWQAVNGWPQLQMGPVVTAEAAALYGGRPGVAQGLLLAAGPMGTVLVLYGLWRLLRAPELRDVRYLGATFAVLYVAFVVTAGRPYYLAGLYGVLAAVGALGLQRRREAGARRWRWVAWPAAGLSAAVAVALLPLSVQLAAPTVGDRVAAGTVQAYDALPPDRRAHTAVMGESYIYAAFLDVYAPEGALPPASSTNRSYGWFPPPPEDEDAVLYVGDDPTELRPHFTDVRRVASIGAETSVWLCSGRQGSWASIWPGLRHLTVS